MISPRGGDLELASDNLTARVPPEQFAQNMRDAHEVAASNGVAVVDLAFPMIDYPVAYSRELEGLDGLFIAPQLPISSFFEFDPVHLNSEGHQRLSEELAAPIRGLLEQGP
jgi:lysophospholipase L1-like esterase